MWPKGKKCTFRVRECHFLGNHITLDEIKPRIEKIEAILNMAPPTTVKEVQLLNGKVATLSRILSRNAEKCRPFFQLLKSTKEMVV